MSDGSSSSLLWSFCFWEMCRESRIISSWNQGINGKARLSSVLAAVRQSSRVTRESRHTETSAVGDE